MDYNSEAIQTFNKHAAAYNERFGKLDLYNDTYEVFCTLLPKKDSRVLDVGCGPGNITQYLLRKRPDLKITGIDLAPNMIAIARENNPGAEFIEMDCRKISKLQDKFDAIVCGFTIPYLSVEETAELISACSSHLNPGGIFYCSLIEGYYEDSGFQLASNRVDRSFVYYYNPVKIISLLTKCNLNIVQVDDFPWENSIGKTETHVVFICSKS